jgi:hypothetical protein
MWYVWSFQKGVRSVESKQANVNAVKDDEQDNDEYYIALMTMKMISSKK